MKIKTQYTIHTKKRYNEWHIFFCSQSYFERNINSCMNMCRYRKLLIVALCANVYGYTKSPILFENEVVTRQMQPIEEEEEKKTKKLHVNIKFH